MIGQAGDLSQGPSNEALAIDFSVCVFSRYSFWNVTNFYMALMYSLGFGASMPSAIS